MRGGGYLKKGGDEGPWGGLTYKKKENIRGGGGLTYRKI